MRILNNDQKQLLTEKLHQVIQNARLEGSTVYIGNTSFKLPTSPSATVLSQKNTTSR